VAVEPVDFRCGIDGLAALCRQRLQADPFCGTLFVPARVVWTRFCNSGGLAHGISLTGFEG